MMRQQRSMHSMLFDTGRHVVVTIGKEKSSLAYHPQQYIAYPGYSWGCARAPHFYDHAHLIM